MDNLFGGAGLGPVNVLVSLAVLSAGAFILVMTTSFVRIVVVLSLVRSAIGTQTTPPNVIVIGLAMVLTLITMMPTLQQVNTQALRPYQQHQIAPNSLATKVAAPIRSFMLAQTQQSDLEFFEHIAKMDNTDPSRVPLYVLIPSFVVGELRAAFAIGLALYLPFIAIDLAVAAILMGLGMFMLSPTVVSLPVKLLLFVSVNGWTLVCGNLITSFRH